VVEPSARFEQLKIPLPEPAHGLAEVSGVLGIPRWWPTGARVGVVLAHGAGADQDDFAIEALHRELTERRYLCLRFNFPWAEAGRRRPDPPVVLRRTLRAAIGALTRDPMAQPAHLFLIGRGLGAEAAADLSVSRLRADGLIMLGYPQKTPNENGAADVDPLYRVVAPMLFLTGTRDRYCNSDTLRRTLARIGAPTELHLVENADHRFRVLKKSGRTPEDISQEMLGVVDGWIEKVLGD